MLTKAVRVHTYGKRPSVDEVPEPTVSGPLDVLVEIGAAGLCRTGLHVIECQWAGKSGVELPYIIGHENASATEPVEMVVARSTQDAIIVNIAGYPYAPNTPTDSGGDRLHLGEPQAVRTSAM